MSPAALATKPSDHEDNFRYDGARVSLQVASQTKLCTIIQGIGVIPSGLLPPSLMRPGGSSVLWNLNRTQSTNAVFARMFLKIDQRLLNQHRTENVNCR